MISFLLDFGVFLSAFAQILTLEGFLVTVLITDHHVSEVA